jgi:hypothetical protein
MVNQSEAYHYAQVLTSEEEEDEEIPETTTIPTAWLLKLFVAVQELKKLFPPLLFSQLQNGDNDDCDDEDNEETDEVQER